MKLAISNIAWNENESEAVYERMKALGFTGLEIAPTKIVGAEPYTKLSEIREFSDRIQNTYNLEICSMQSIWFGRTEHMYKSSKEREALLEYTKEAVRFAQSIGCKNLVFGCPKSRSLLNAGDEALAEKFFVELGEYAAVHDTVIALEANPDIYGTNFINYTKEAFEYVKRLACPGLKVNLDMGTIIQNGEGMEVLEGYVEYINHIHISEPYLAAVNYTDRHNKLAEWLKANNYSKYVSIEMKEQPIDVVFDAMDGLKKIFA